MMDAYWNKDDPFEHDVFELYAHAMSPEEFIQKWRDKMNEYIPFTEEQAKIVYGLLRHGANDLARDFIKFIEDKETDNER